MGHAADTWRIKGDCLCRVRPEILDDCYEVWVAGDRVELRLRDFPPLQGFLPALRQVTRTASSKSAVPIRATPFVNRPIHQSDRGADERVVGRPVAGQRNVSGVSPRVLD